MKRAYLNALCVATLLVLFSCASSARKTSSVVAIIPQEAAAPILASAAPEPSPTTQPAPAVEAAPQLPAVPESPTLPQGHPDIAQMIQQRQGGGGQLPKGHPDISQMSKPAAGIGRVDNRAGCLYS